MIASFLTVTLTALTVQASDPALDRAPCDALAQVAVGMETERLGHERRSYSLRGREPSAEERTEQAARARLFQPLAAYLERRNLQPDGSLATARAHGLGNVTSGQMVEAFNRRCRG